MWIALLAAVSLVITGGEGSSNIYHRNKIPSGVFNMKIGVMMEDCVQYCEQYPGCTTIGLESSLGSSNCYINNGMVPGSLPLTVGSNVELWIERKYIEIRSEWKR